MEFGGFMQHNRLSASWDDLNPSEEIDLSLRLGLPHHHNHQTPPPFPLPQHHHHDQIIASYQQCENVSQKVKLRCAMCGKTETPLWRKGPNGPKTLCNGCGLRYARALKKH